MKEVFEQILTWFEDTFQDGKTQDWYHERIVDSVVAPYRTKAELKEELSGIIDSLQPALPDIEDPGIPGKDFIPVEWVDACEMYGKWKIVKQEQPEEVLEQEIDRWFGEKYMQNMEGLPIKPIVQIIARHFAEWGAIHLRK